MYQKVNQSVVFSTDMKAQAEVVKFYQESLDFSELNESGEQSNSYSYQITQNSKRPFRVFFDIITFD